MNKPLSNLTPNEALFFRWLALHVNPETNLQSYCLQPCFITSEIDETLLARFDRK